MNALTAACLACLCFPPHCGAEEPIRIEAQPHLWTDALPLMTKAQSALVLDMPELTQLRGFVKTWPHPAISTEPEVRARVVEIDDSVPTQKHVDLKIEWLLPESPTDFTRTFLPEKGIAESTCRLGGAKITRTVLASDEDGAVFVHLLADKPGALSFRVSPASGNLDPRQIKIEDRRQIVLPANDQADSLGMHVWVIPFESDVTPDDRAIIVRGEGEALILLTYAAGAGATETLADTLKRLGNRYDPGQTPPDPSKIWHAVLDSRMKSVENSP